MHCITVEALLYTKPHNVALRKSPKYAYKQAQILESINQVAALHFTSQRDTET